MLYAPTITYSGEGEQKHTLLENLPPSDDEDGDEPAVNESQKAIVKDKKGIVPKGEKVSAALQASRSEQARTSQPDKELVAIIHFAHEGFAAVYQDDIIIFSDTVADHKQHVLRILNILSKEKLYVAPNKMALFCKYVRYLGAVVGNGKLAMDPLKVETINDMPKPTTTKDIRSFLGAAGFMRRWIPHYAKKSKPLNDLLAKEHKGQKVDPKDITPLWGSEQDESVKALKEALTSYPVLRQFDPNRPVTIITDASDYAVGAAMCQLYEGKLCAVAYAARTLRGAEINYSVQEKEALGTIFGVKKFRHYIMHSRFELRILSDHESLKFLKSQDKALVGRMARWAMYLQQYNFEIKYIKGPTNSLADALSRNISLPASQFSTAASLLELYPETQRQVMSCLARRGLVGEPATSHNGGGESASAADATHSTNHDCGAHEGVRTSYRGRASIVMELDEGFINSDKDTQRESILFVSSMPSATWVSFKCTDYSKDRYLSQLYEALTRKANGVKAKSGTPEYLYESKMRQRLQNYFLNNGFLYKITADGNVLCVPHNTPKTGPNARCRIINELHGGALAGHRGVQATYIAVRRRFYWNNMMNDIKSFVGSCEECQSSKISRQAKGGLLVPLEIPATHGTHYGMDFLTDLPASGRDEHDTCFVVIDRFSKRIYLIPTWKNASAAVTAELFFLHVVRHKGIPLALVGDRDSKWTSKFWSALWATLGTQVALSSARQQQTDSGVNDFLLSFNSQYDTQPMILLTILRAGFIVNKHLKR